MKILYKLWIICFLGIGFNSCNKTPEIEDHMLDGGIVFDPSINNPEEFLISARYPNPKANDLEKHIIIAAHGYTASTFEWSEFQEWSQDPDYRISQLLLDGHGRDYESFKASKWEDWLKALTREYELLASLGYQKISFVGSSTGSTLILELLRSGYFDTRLTPKNIFLIDPIIVPSEKLQSIIGIIGPMIVFAESDASMEKDQFWYRFKPVETIKELNELMKNVKNGLQDGFTLSNDTYLKVFHSHHDPTANSLSSVLIYKGLKHVNGNNIDVQIMDSDIHVFTRLKLRESVTKLHKDNQLYAFNQMAAKLK
jgi:carboxylesterase